MSTGKVLVIDHDKNICELLRLYLEKEGYSVSLAHDGEDALSKFSAVKPDIVADILHIRRVRELQKQLLHTGKITLFPV